MKTKSTLSIIVIALSTLLTVSLLLSLLATNLISLNYKAEAQQTTTTTAKVQVGGGSNTYPFYGYNPQQIQVKVGSKVVWTTPSNAPIEPHTVTFVLNSKTMTAPDTPFAVPSSTKFMPLPPGSNSEPNIVPSSSTKNGMNTVIVNNGRSYYPVTMDSTGRIKAAPPNASFTMKGNEQYVNSGWLVPKAGQKDFPGSSNTFTVVFQKAGTYNYLCILHPWMTGSIVVK